MSAARRHWVRTVVAAVHSGAEALVSVIFPPHCILCGAFAPRLADHEVCADCWGTLLPLPEPLCRCCGLPLPGAIASAAPLCGRCLTAPPAFHMARAGTTYQGAARELIHRLKFRRRPDLAVPLGRCLQDAVRRWPELLECDALVAVPLHRRRQKERGFNQAQLLAEELARHCGRPLLRGALRRARNTQAQSELSDVDRDANVRGAFRVADRAAVAGKRLLLIDDVQTSGATLEACAQALLQAGAARVCALTVARVAERRTHPPPEPPTISMQSP